jgi:hypothetical protein
LLAVAFAGKSIEYNGLNAECIDGIDNNANGFIDYQESACQDYPHADGNGETITSSQDKWQSEGYEFTIFEYVLNYGTLSNQEICDGWVNGADTYYYDLQYSYSNGKDFSYTYGLKWVGSNCP